MSAFRQKFGNPNTVLAQNANDLHLWSGLAQGELPAAWGMDGAFPQLQELELGQNQDLGGTLPAAWGSDNSSLTALQLFKVSTGSVKGSLPAQWAQNLPAITNLNISNNLISGGVLELLIEDLVMISWRRDDLLVKL